MTAAGGVSSPGFAPAWVRPHPATNRAPKAKRPPDTWCPDSSTATHRRGEWCRDSSTFGVRSHRRSHGYGWRAYDVAYYVTRIREQHRQPFLHGYESVRPPTDAEEDMIPTIGRLA